MVLVAGSRALITDLLVLGGLQGVVAQDSRGTRDGREAEPVEQTTRRLLGGEPLQNLRRRPDERQVVGAHGVGEAGVFGEESVARVDRVAARDDRGRDHRRRREVAPPGVCRPDTDRLVGQLHRQAFAVRLAVGNHRRHAELDHSSVVGFEDDVAQDHDDS